MGTYCETKERPAWGAKLTFTSVHVDSGFGLNHASTAQLIKMGISLEGGKERRFSSPPLLATFEATSVACRMRVVEPSKLLPERKPR